MNSLLNKLKEKLEYFKLVFIFQKAFDKDFSKLIVSYVDKAFVSTFRKASK